MQTFHVIAALFRPDAPKLKIVSTAKDIIAVHGLLFPMAPFDSNGVQVVVE